MSMLRAAHMWDFSPWGLLPRGCPEVSSLPPAAVASSTTLQPSALSGSLLRVQWKPFGAAGAQTGSLVCLSDCGNKWTLDRRNFRFFCITWFLLPKLFSIFFRQEERTSNQWDVKVTKSSLSRWQRCCQPTWAGSGTEVYWPCLDLARLAESWILSFILYWTSLEVTVLPTLVF